MLRSKGFEGVSFELWNLNELLRPKIKNAWHKINLWQKVENYFRPFVFRPLVPDQQQWYKFTPKEVRKISNRKVYSAKLGIEPSNSGFLWPLDLKYSALIVTVNKDMSQKF